MDNRDIYRNQRRAFRQQMRYRRRGAFGGFGGLILVIIGIMVLNHHLWSMFPLVFFAFPLFFFITRAMRQRGNWSMSQPQQPDSQLYQQNQPVYQQPVQPEQPEQPVYQPYTQGYQPQQTPAQSGETYQEAGQQYQYPAQQNTQQQYEEPLTMYPQE